MIGMAMSLRCVERRSGFLKLTADSSTPVGRTSRPNAHLTKSCPAIFMGNRSWRSAAVWDYTSLELARRGAKGPAIDLTNEAVEATQARMKGFGVQAEVRCADAESLPYDNKAFDFVWSWGVIHHSARTARIVREIARVLKPHGEARVMVYNREGRIARLLLFRHYLLGGEFIHRSPDETLWRWSDGYSARFYHKEQFEDLFRGFFEDVSSVVLGQDVDVVPLPRHVRGIIASQIPDRRKLAVASRVGGFLFLTASNPVR